MVILGNAVSGSTYKSIQCRWAGYSRLGCLLLLSLLLLLLLPLEALPNFVLEKRKWGAPGKVSRDWLMRGRLTPDHTHAYVPCVPGP